ncbi:hypothetical protein OG884_18945 [Streptosporangium sp. NBC_01755]|uniref:hypothetical protein n=1 Tax=Streptosporangium sp. NBC_01755 TaxID=2975949 RepID=UPI002DDAF114|nr:hypothetical protein [Streptosporangium sp. NBC_01755]WSD01409.1 hypothetical protein OG884_05650 [Streptosporangium sp. NBC_01755]WSD03887.1 hypothetical protein OG884_18945 [Streptosporangium sp. NBC_01755]
MKAPDICAEILKKVPEMLPLEAWRLAHGWSRARAIEEIAALYAEDGLERPDVNTVMLCKWEHGQGKPGSVYSEVLCRLYGVSAERLGLPTPKRRNRNFGDDEREDPMERRTLIKAAGVAGVAVPLHLLLDLEAALAVPVESSRPAALAEIQQRLQAARGQFDISALAPLLAEFPALLSAALDTAKRVDTPAGWATLASCYNLAADVLNKVGRKDTGLRTADHGVLYAQRSEDAVAQGASARAMGMMLRTTGQHDAATRVVERAADTLEVMGLRKAPQLGTYLRLMCTSAYTASQADDREEAFARLAEAERAAERLVALTGKPEAEPFTRMYRMNIHYSLGDAGAALQVGKDLRPEMYPTPERRGRLHTDLARAWWMRGRPEETASALLEAYREAPSEVRDRPKIRRIADDLTAVHPRVAGVRELATALAGRRPLP